MCETEERFWAWDYQRWTKDLCARGSSGGWQRAPLQNSFADVQEKYPAVVQLITAQHMSRRMMPFRRRDFEATALVRELLLRAGHSPGIQWGRHLPAPKAELSAELSVPRRIWITASIPPAAELQFQLSRSLCALSPNIRIALSLKEATHVLFLLTDGIVSDKSAEHTPPARQLLEAQELKLPTGS